MDRGTVLKRSAQNFHSCAIEEQTFAAKSQIRTVYVLSATLGHHYAAIQIRIVPIKVPQFEQPVYCPQSRYQTCCQIISLEIQREVEAVVQDVYYQIGRWDSSPPERYVLCFP